MQRDGVSDSEADRERPVTGQVRTFLIADARGYTQFTVEHGDEAAAQLAARFAEIATAVASARDGQVIEVRGDEVLAVFSSARQALRAAVDLQARLDQGAMSLGVGVGLDAGEAVPVGDGYRGAALNLAARLCSLAGSGEILASDTVVNLARKVEGVTYAERGAVQLKGFADPVRIVEIRSSGSEPPESLPTVSMRWPETGTGGQRLPIGGFLGSLPSGTLVARGEELRRILTAVDAVEAEEGQLVMLAGEPGAGKTRLAQEATLHARNRSFLIAAGSCYEARQAVPFSPFLDALAALYAAAPVAVRSAVPQRWPYLGRLLPETPVPAVVTGTSTQEEQDRLFRAVTSFVQACADEVPVALLLDDLHWADESSLQLLQHLARHTRTHRLLLLGTYRDVEVGAHHPLERALRDLRRDGLMGRVALRRLDRENTAELLAATLGVETISDELSHLVYDHTEGNPFFTQEVVRALVERGDIYRENGHWERRTITQIDVPESVRSVIRERLSRLDMEGQEVLHEASVLGQTFGFVELRGMAGRSERSIEEALEGAIAAGLIREAGKDTYAFSHALTQQALYAELSGRRKRRLHLAAGEAIEQTSTGRGGAESPRAAELARHFLEADDVERALQYSLLAGDQAEAIFAHAEAERHYRTTVQLAREIRNVSPEAEALEKLGGMFTIIGRFDEALELLEQALPLLQAEGGTDAAARVLAHIGRVHWKRGTPQEGIARLEPMLERFAGDEPVPGHAALYAVLGHLYFGSGRYREQLDASERASQLARALGNDHILAEAELRRGSALTMLGRPTDGIQVLEEITPVMEKIGDLVNLTIAFVNLASAHWDGGELDLCRGYLERAAQLTRQTGDLAETAFVVAQVADTMFTQGEWEQAEARIKEAIAITRSTETFWKAAYPPLTLGEICLAEGRLEEARASLEECVAIASRSRDLQGLRHAHSLLAERDLMEGQADAARARLEPLLEEGGADVTAMLPILAMAHMARGDVARADEIVTGAIARARAQGSRPTLADALRVKALVLARQEDQQAALRTLEEGLSLARAIRYPYAEARMLYEYGVVHAQQGQLEAARERLEEALAIFRRLGARPYIDRTEQRLAEVK